MFDVLLDEEDIVVEEEDAGKERDVRASVKAAISLFSSLLILAAMAM